MPQALSMARDCPKLQLSKLHPFQCGEDIDMFLLKFEQPMTAYMVARPLYLSLLLEGGPLTAFLAIPAEAAENFDAVKEALE